MSQLIFLLNCVPAVLGRESALPLLGEDHLLVAAAHAEHRADQRDGQHDEGDAHAQDGPVGLPHAAARRLGRLGRLPRQVQLSGREK